MLHFVMTLPLFRFPIGIKAIQLLHRLHYEVRLIDHPESGRAAISKGLLPKAQKEALKNVQIFHPLISEETPLLGIEPSAILGFRDEYPRLVPKDWVARARELQTHCLLIDEFLAKEMAAGNIRSEQFTDAPHQLLLHGHCHQKALASIDPTAWVLSLPSNYSVTVIPSGCCGMAGSFGYEKEHYDISMQIGQLVLFPAVEKAAATTTIVAPGTSCRHQIADGTGRVAQHPVEVLYDALK
ncbi:MAG: hypothetical protein AAGD05_03695 [Bacteroidota bacterium]